MNRGMTTDGGDSPSKMASYSAVPTSPKVVLQMSQTGSPQLQTQQQQLQQQQQQLQQQQLQQLQSSPMKHELQQQLHSPSPTLSQQQQQALLAALQHHDKLKGFSLDASDGVSHQSTPTQSPTSAINVNFHAFSLYMAYVHVHDGLKSR